MFHWMQQSPPEAVAGAGEAGLSVPRPAEYPPPAEGDVRGTVRVAIRRCGGPLDLEFLPDGVRTVDGA